MRRFKPLMNSKLVSGTATRAVINPATEDVLADAPLADRAQLDEAVAAAKAAVPRMVGPTHTREGYVVGEVGRCAKGATG